MSCYISSNNNRAYVALEENFGEVAAITEANRIPLVKLAVRQQREAAGRRDKTGSRTFVGLPNRVRKETTFRLNTLMTAWSNAPAAPAHGALFQAGLGGTPLAFAGGTVASVPAATQVTLTAAHGLTLGQAVTFGGEMRFVTGIVSPTTVALNAAFTTPPAAGQMLGPTVTYPLATALKSVSLFDYWDPAGAVQRIVQGGAVDVVRVKVNGDYHEFEFSGPARDVLDSVSFEAGQGGLSAFPPEPPSVAFDYSVIPGHVGQVWMGAAPSQMHALTAAELTVDNHVMLRAREFGADYAKCIAAGQRSVRLDFRVFAHADAISAELYQAARQRSPVEVMLQLGEQAGQLFGAYLPAVAPEVPEYEDREVRLEWSFSNNLGQGTVDDELFVAFG
jgi:hypothetical protein